MVKCSVCHENGMGADAFGHNKRNRECPFNNDVAIEVALQNMVKNGFDISDMI